MDDSNLQIEEELTTKDNTRAERRKNEWKFAKRNQRIADNLGGQYDKPLHYYSKTAPEYYYQRRNKTNNKGKHRTAYGNYNPAKNWDICDKRRIDDLENQMDELFDLD